MNMNVISLIRKSFFEVICYAIKSSMLYSLLIARELSIYMLGIIIYSVRGYRIWFVVNIKK